MAGGAGALLITDLAGLRPEWLDSAEVSIALDGPRVKGLSFFFHDEANCAGFAAAESLDRCVLSDEKALREKFSILPRYWLKLHFDGGRRCGLSQYLQINPIMHYPITTIRCFLRKYGMSDVGMIEELLRPALEAPETEWGLAIKRSPGRVVPRVFFSIPRPLIRQVLAPFIRLGYLSQATGLQYLEWENRTRAGERIFISLDPTLGKLSSLDFSDVPSDQLPEPSRFGYSGKLQYLKLRIADYSQPPELTAYLPFTTLKQHL